MCVPSFNLLELIVPEKNLTKIFKAWKLERKMKLEDHWPCIAHLSAEDMLKSEIIEEKTFKHSPWAGADNH